MYTVAVRALCEFTAKQGDLDLRFTPSPTAQEGINGHAVVTSRRGPNYRATRGTFTVTRDGTQVDVMHPEKRIYNAGGMPMTEAAIDSGPFGDRYVSLGDPVGDGSWSVRVYSKPFVTWIWGGCILMALGGFIALLDRRYRTATRREPALPKGARAAGAD